MGITIKRLLRQPVDTNDMCFMYDPTPSEDVDIDGNKRAGSFIDGDGSVQPVFHDKADGSMYYYINQDA